MPPFLTWDSTFSLSLSLSLSLSPSLSLSKGKTKQNKAKQKQKNKVKKKTFQENKKIELGAVNFCIISNVNVLVRCFYLKVLDVCSFSSVGLLNISRKSDVGFQNCLKSLVSKTDKKNKLIQEFSTLRFTASYILRFHD